MTALPTAPPRPGSSASGAVAPSLVLDDAEAAA
jgi:hypothetical protein